MGPQSLRSFECAACRYWHISWSASLTSTDQAICASLATAKGTHSAQATRAGNSHPLHWPSERRPETLVLQNRLDHSSPNSDRTTFTPSTSALNFLFAAQRAVWLSPQSGARESRSAGTYLRQLRTRAATSSDVSM